MAGFSEGPHCTTGFRSCRKLCHRSLVAVPRLLSRITISDIEWLLSNSLNGETAFFSVQ